jgi:hypothetical protein
MIRKAVFTALMMGAAYVVLSSVPEFARYLKIRRM